MTQIQTLVGLLADGSIQRMKQLAGAGISASTVQMAVRSGIVERLSRGTYRAFAAGHHAEGHLAEALARIPHGTVCLFSAADVHRLGDASPTRAWVAIPHGSRASSVEWPPVRYVRWRDPRAFTIGVDIQTIAGVRVPITSAARTVVDMLRMLSTVGEGEALQCLRDYHRSGRPLLDLHDVARRLECPPRVEETLRMFTLVARVA